MASQNRVLLDKIVQCFNTGDLRGVEETFAPTYLDHQKPNWLEAHGPDEFKQIVAIARRSIPNLKVTIRDVIDDGDEAIAARLHWEGMSEAGERNERETIEILRLRDGLVVEHWGAVSLRRSGESS